MKPKPPEQWTQEKLVVVTQNYYWKGDIMVPTWEQKISKRIKGERK